MPVNYVCSHCHYQLIIPGRSSRKYPTSTFTDFASPKEIFDYFHGECPNCKMSLNNTIKIDGIKVVSA